MTPDEARAFLTDHHNAMLATLRRDGRPQLSVVFATVDEQGRVIISPGRRRSRQRTYGATRECR
jgi:pyridoxine/pyridoxamine 5'-phosphate oxidase